MHWLSRIFLEAAQCLLREPILAGAHDAEFRQYSGAGREIRLCSSPSQACIEEHRLDIHDSDAIAVWEARPMTKRASRPRRQGSAKQCHNKTSLALERHRDCSGLHHECHLGRRRERTLFAWAVSNSCGCAFRDVDVAKRLSNTVWNASHQCALPSLP